MIPPLEDGVSPDFRRLLNFYQDVRPDATYTTRKRKGVLRVRL